MPSFKVIVGALFALLISAIFVLGLVSYRYNERVINTSFWVNHTQRVIQLTDEISSVFKDVQLESNAIYIKGDTTRIDHYRAARRKIFALIEEIRDLTNDNMIQKGSVDSLSKLIPQLLGFADAALSSPAVVTSQDVYRRSIQTNDFRDRANVILNRIERRERRLLRQREQEYSSRISSFNEVFGELLAGIAILIAVAFFSIRYNFNKLLRIDEKLRQAQDKTEKALATEIELNKLKSNFVTLASHEFRTPLTTILSSASLLENYTSGENQSKASRHISRIKSSVNSLTTILDEFLSLTKIEEGRMEPHVERFDLKQYLEGCIANLQNFAKSGQTILYAHGGDDEAETDPVFVGNIINNLVSNAIKYSPENSMIYVSSHVNDTIHLSVQDNGIGIPDEDQKHLFERFYRASNAGTVQGTGLGLHIMKHYVDMLNGTVKIKSEVGKGTSVEVTLKPR
ncbi:MAG TPA: ATP-binding protein [Cyclobacteriaceae bacterium]|nr:ATP-binding protein [Cyclobacteriaceae bacterium]